MKLTRESSISSRKTSSRPLNSKDLIKDLPLRSKRSVILSFSSICAIFISLFFKKMS